MLRLLPLVVVLLLVAAPVAAQSPADPDTTYRVGIRVTHDILTMPLGIKRLDLDEHEPIDFSDEITANAAVDTVWIYDGSFDSIPVDAEALPDTGSVARPFLSVRSPAFAQALTTFQPHFIGRVFHPPFDTLVVNRRGHLRKRKDFSISYLIGFRNNANRSDFMAAVAALDGVLWVYPDRKLDDFGGDL
jgi:hypothetical protein